MVDWCRERGALLVSDECYLECALGGRAGLGAAPRRLRRLATTGILAVHSLSKRSNLAGYRCAFVAGDPALVGELLAVRKNLGLHDARPAAGARWSPRSTTTRTSTSSTRATPPAARCCGRRSRRAGFRIDHSEASLYLWATRDEACWDTVAWLAERGHPGRAGRRSTAAPAREHVRVAFTATDERVGGRRTTAGWPAERPGQPACS